VAELYLSIGVCRKLGRRHVDFLAFANTEERFLVFVALLSGFPVFVLKNTFAFYRCCESLSWYFDLQLCENWKTELSIP